jgi:hypothetical protein
MARPKIKGTTVALVAAGVGIGAAAVFGSMGRKKSIQTANKQPPQLVAVVQQKTAQAEEYEAAIASLESTPDQGSGGSNNKGKTRVGGFTPPPEPPASSSNNFELEESICGQKQEEAETVLSQVGDLKKKTDSSNSKTDSSNSKARVSIGMEVAPPPEKKEQGSKPRAFSAPAALEASSIKPLEVGDTRQRASSAPVAVASTPVAPLRPAEPLDSEGQGRPRGNSVSAAAPVRSVVVDSGDYSRPRANSVPARGFFGFFDGLFTPQAPEEVARPRANTAPSRYAKPVAPVAPVASVAPPVAPPAVTARTTVPSNPAGLEAEGSYRSAGRVSLPSIPDGLEAEGSRRSVGGRGSSRSVP